MLKRSRFNFNADEAWIAADPLTAILGALVSFAAIFGLWSALGLSADQMAELGGVVTTVGAASRALYNQKRKRDKKGSEDDVSEPG